ncbi:hypothetical protein D3C85_1538320 [compost metagenome]
MACGMIAPCSPVRPRASQSRKNPSIFSLTPPTAWTSPNWLIEPVMAKHCLSGVFDKAEISVQASPSEALSPST